MPIVDKLEKDTPTWDGRPMYTEGRPVMEDQLDATQKGELQQLLEDYPEVVSGFVPTWKNELAEKLQVQGRVPFHATTHAGQHSLA